MRTHGAVVGRRFRSVTKLTTKVRIGRGYLWGSFLIAAAALKTPTRNGSNAQGANLKFFVPIPSGTIDYRELKCYLMQYARNTNEARSTLSLWGANMQDASDLSSPAAAAPANAKSPANAKAGKGGKTPAKKDARAKTPAKLVKSAKPDTGGGAPSSGEGPNHSVRVATFKVRSYLYVFVYIRYV